VSRGRNRREGPFVSKAVELKGNAGIPLPERKGDVAYLGVKPGSEPRQLRGENLFIVSCKAAELADADKKTFTGQWYTSSTLEPLVFRRRREGPLPRADTVAEVPGEPYFDDNEEQACFLIEPETLVLLLDAIRGADQQGEPDEALDPLEDDYADVFGMSQLSQSKDPNRERDERAAARSQSSQQVRSSANTSSKAKVTPQLPACH
jgi:hypothetical protein